MADIRPRSEVAVQKVLLATRDGRGGACLIDHVTACNKLVAFAFMALIIKST